MRALFNAFLEDDEKIIKVFRVPLNFKLKSLTRRGFFWASIVFCLWFFFPFYGGLDLGVLWKIVAVGGSIHFLIPVFFWYVNALVMTNEALVLIEWKGFFIRKCTRIEFHNLDDISVERLGVRSFILNYGNLIFEKANGGNPLVVKNIKNPHKASQSIDSYREQYMNNKNFNEESTLKTLLSSMVKRHVGPDHVSSEENPSSPEPKKSSRKKTNNVTIEKVLDNDGGIEIDLDQD